MVPIIKNKTGDTSDKNNYRPIALVTLHLNCLNFLFLKFRNLPVTQDYQFGFKAKHSTEMCIFIDKKNRCIK